MEQVSDHGIGHQGLPVYIANHLDTPSAYKYTKS